MDDVVEDDNTRIASREKKNAHNNFSKNEKEENKTKNPKEKWEMMKFKYIKLKMKKKKTFCRKTCQQHN